MKREDHRTDGDLSRRDLSKRLDAWDRVYLACSATVVGFITAVFLAGCASAMGAIAATPADPTAAYENELVTSLGLGSEPESMWTVASDGSPLNLAPEYAEAEKTANVVFVTGGSGSGTSASYANRRIVHPDDYLGDSTDVGKAFTSAVVDDTMSHSAGSEASAVSFW